MISGNWGTAYATGNAGYLRQYFQQGNSELERRRKTTWIFADEFYLLFRYENGAGGQKAERN